MIMDNVVLKLLEYSTAKPKIEITWDNNQSSLCEIDTFYDTDNGLDWMMKATKNTMLRW